MIAVDVGNTKTAFALFRNDVLVRQSQVETDIRRTTNDYRNLINEFLRPVGISLKATEQITAASVVPAITEQLKPLAKDVDVHFVSHESPISFEIALADPRSLGADRIANMEGAVRKYGAPVIVVDVGTAISVSVLNRRKQFLGGALAPGVGISLDALFSSTALIRRGALDRPKRAIGSTTLEAIGSGIHFGYAAMVDGLVSKMKEDLGEKEVAVVGKGGTIDMLAPYIDPHFQLYPTLTLEGLRFIYENLRSQHG
ncbi:MAG TPA: type III pantothenate kinase [Bdellovibrionota bacterium]|nr:type III pantothenate kinase [Bdellovibrionota bacterium]